MFISEKGALGLTMICNNYDNKTNHYTEHIFKHKNMFSVFGSVQPKSLISLDSPLGAVDDILVPNPPLGNGGKFHL